MKTRKGRHILWEGLETEQASCDRETDGQTDTLLYLLTTSPSARLPAHISVLVRIATIHNIFQKLGEQWFTIRGPRIIGNPQGYSQGPYTSSNFATNLRTAELSSWMKCELPQCQICWRQTVNTSVEQFDAHTKQLTYNHWGHYTRQ